MNMKLIAFTIWIAVGVCVLFGPRDWRRLTNHILHPGYSCCGRCCRTWDVVNGHSTPHGDAVWEVTTPNAPDSYFSMEGVPNDGGTHTVTVPNGVSSFPLCEECWQALTPKTRLPYYRQLIDERKKWDTATEKSEDTWPRMKAAVEAGL